VFIRNLQQDGINAESQNRKIPSLRGSQVTSIQQELQDNFHAPHLPPFSFLDTGIYEGDEPGVGYCQRGALSGPERSPDKIAAYIFN